MTNRFDLRVGAGRRASRAARRFLLGVESLERREMLSASNLPVTSGLVLRLSADEGVSTIGNTVTGWEDLSSAGNHANKVTGSPTIVPGALNGHDVIRFDGNGDGLGRDGLSGMPTGSANRTVFFVASHDRLRQGGFVYGNAAANQAFGLEMAASGRLAVESFGENNEFRSTSVGLDFGFMTQSVVLENNTFVHYANGELIDTKTHTFNTQANRMRIASTIDETSRNIMDVAEILVYNRALSATERQAVENHLATHYMPYRAGFRQELVTDQTQQPVALTFLPDGRMLIVEQQGRIKITNPNNTPASTSTYLQIPNVDGQDERGLLDIALDPNFSSNGHFYVYYAKSTTSKFQISRFTHNGSTASPSSEVMIWQHPTAYSSCCHHGGGLTFGGDGKLYLSTGEEFLPDRSQDLSSASGKVIRLNKDGSIPNDNPFVNQSGALPEVYAYGLRNPYRLDYDPINGQLLVTEVGGNNQATAAEDVHRVRSGANFGWPECEGQCSNGAYDDPIFSYDHEFIGAAIIGGFTHDGTGVPSAMRGDFIYADYTRRWVRALGFDTNKNVTYDQGISLDANFIVGLQQGPDGSIYYADISGAIRRFRFTGDASPPTVTQASVNVTQGASPLTVQFTGNATSESGTINYRWDFGDGQEAFTKNATHTYNSNGNYVARLYATNSNGTATSDAIAITVGTPPTVSITQPEDGSSFLAGQTINYAATANDPDGSNAAITYNWSIDFVHNLHTHPVLRDGTGRTGSVEVSTSGHDYSDDTAYRLTVVATDTEGLTATDSITVYPDKVDMTLTSSPAGIPLTLDSLPVSTPRVHDTLINFEHQISAPATYCIVGIRHTFDSWSDGGARTHTVTVPHQDFTVRANYRTDDLCGPNEPGDGVTPQPGIDLVGRAGNKLWVGVSSGVEASNENWGDWSNQVTWHDVMVADVDGDGLDDIIGRTGSGVWWAARSNGREFILSRWGEWNPNANWSFVQVGDFNGDGKDDVAGFANGKWWIARSTDNGFENELWTEWSPRANWTHVMVGDFNADGRSDIVGRAGSSWWVARSTGDAFVNTFQGQWSANVNWQDVQLADVDNDNRSDIVGRAGGTWWVARSQDGQLVNEVWGRWSPNINWRDVTVGDFNGDGRDDIAGRGNGSWWVAKSDGTEFTNEQWGTWGTQVTWKDVLVGDVNNDGRDDILGRANGSWWAAISVGSNFYNRLWTQWSGSVNWQNVLIGQFSVAGRSGSGVSFDFNGDAVLDARDLDALCSAIGLSSDDIRFDVDQDGDVDLDDHAAMVESVFRSEVGDANLDGTFDTEDLVQIFQNGKYNTQSPAGWADGDWNCDGIFDSTDIILALQNGAIA